MYIIHNIYITAKLDVITDSIKITYKLACICLDVEDLQRLLPGGEVESHQCWLNDKVSGYYILCMSKAKEVKKTN